MYTHVGVHGNDTHITCTFQLLAITALALSVWVLSFWRLPVGWRGRKRWVDVGSSAWFLFECNEAHPATPARGGPRCFFRHGDAPPALAGSSAPQGALLFLSFLKQTRFGCAQKITIGEFKVQVPSFRFCSDPHNKQTVKVQKEQLITLFTNAVLL